MLLVTEINSLSFCRLALRAERLTCQLVCARWRDIGLFWQTIAGANKKLGSTNTQSQLLTHNH